MTRSYLSLALLLVAYPALSIPPSWLPANISGVKSAIAEQGTAIDLLRTSVVNVKSCVAGQMFCASGSAQATTGSITAGSTSLTVASAIDFAVGQGISVANAGAASALLVAKITAISGTTITLDTAAGTTASAKAVKHDDTAAIQAAIDSYAYGGPVLMPWGVYVISSTVTFRSSTRLLGVSQTYYADATAAGTRIDATAITGATTAIMMAAGRPEYQSLEDLTLTGPTSSPSSTGINLGGVHTNLRRVRVVGFRIGIAVTAAAAATIEDSWVDLTGYRGIDVYQGGDIRISRCTLANNAQANGANLLIRGGATDVRITDTVFDEAFGANSAPLRIDLATNISVRGSIVYLTHTGYGILMGDGSGNNPTNVSLQDIVVKPFGAGVPVNTILLRGSGHVLINVVTTPNGGGDVSDTATNTTMLNVNGAYKLPTLPTSDPGAGSKQLWADPADGYTVKLAN